MQKIESESFKPVAHVEADLQSLIPSFLNNRKRDILELRKAVETTDFNDLERIGHILKGVSASYGFDKLGEYGAILEAQAKAGALQKCDAVVNLMSTYMQDVVVVYV